MTEPVRKTLNFKALKMARSSVKLLTGFMTTKEAVIRLIRRLPEDATLSDIMAELYFRQKVDKGRRQLRNGQGIPHAKVRSRLKRWLG